MHFTKKCRSSSTIKLILFNQLEYSIQMIIHNRNGSVIILFNESLIFDSYLLILILVKRRSISSTLIIPAVTLNRLMSVVPFSWITLIQSTNAFSLYAKQVSQVWRQVAEISDHVLPIGCTGNWQTYPQKKKSLLNWRPFQFQMQYQKLG